MTSDICPFCGRSWSEHSCGACTFLLSPIVSLADKYKAQRDSLLAVVEAVFDAEFNYACGCSTAAHEKLLLAVQDLKDAVKEVEGGRP